MILSATTDLDPWAGSATVVTLGQVLVTSWTDAPIPWPRGLPEGKGPRGHPGLVVTRELERAIRTESAAALMHHFGIRDTLAWRWRTWAGVEGHTATEGSRRLQQEVSEKGAAGIKPKEWTDAELDAQSELAKRLGRRPPDRWAARRRAQRMCSSRLRFSAIRARGVYLPGVSLEGAVLKQDDDANKSLYGRTMAPKEILFAGARRPQRRHGRSMPH